MPSQIDRQRLASLRELLQRTRATGWAELDGLVVEGTIPITEALLNDLLDAERTRMESQFFQLHRIVVRPDNVLRVELSVGSAFMAKRLAPELRLTSLGGFPAAPQLTVAMPRRYALPFGGLARSRIDPLGRFLRLEGGTITVKLRALLEELSGEEISNLVELVRSVAIRTEAGTLFVDFSVGVDTRTGSTEAAVER